MNELGALLSILPYALSVALLAALLQRLAGWSDGPSIGDLLSGPRDLPWPQGVQEEEPIRWHVEALRPRHGQRGTVVSRTEPDRPRSQVPAPRPGQVVRPRA